MSIKKERLIVIPRAIGFLSIVASSIIFILANQEGNLENKNNQPPTQKASATVTNDDTVICDRALGQENKDELASLVNQEEPKRDPCQFAACGGLF